MPVLVTRADHEVGHAVVERLLRLGGQVRAWCTGGTEATSGPGELRRMGAVVASGDLDDEGHLETAMAQVHTVLHVHDGLTETDAEALAVAGETIARAAEGAGVARLVALSVHGADLRAVADTGSNARSPSAVAGSGSSAPGDTAARRVDPLRLAAGRVEAALASASVPSVVVRTSLVDRAAVRDVVAQAPTGLAAQDTAVAPVPVDALADLLVAIDDVRGGGASGGGHLRLAADGRPTTLGAWRSSLGAGSEGGLVGRVWRPDAARTLVLRGLGGPWTLDEAGAGAPIDDAWPVFGLPTPDPS